MRHLYKIALIACILQCLLLTKTYASVITYDWTGATSSSWTLPGNWKVGGVTQTANYPGTSSNDIAQIDINYTFTNQPVIGSSLTIGGLIIGTKVPFLSSTPATNSLTINAGLTINGDFTVKNDDGGHGSTTNLSGSGSITCNNFYVGDSTTPPTPIIGLANVTYQTILNFSSLNLSVGQNIVLTTTSSSALVNIFQSANVNNAVFNFNSGTVSVGNSIQTVDSDDVNLTGFTLLVVTYLPISSSAQFLSHPSAGNTTTLILNGANSLNLDGSAGYVDFNCACGGISTTYYSGSANQEVYTTSTPYSSAGRQSPVGLDRTPAVYQNVVFSGAGIKTADGGSLTVANNLTLAASSTETLELATNNPVVTITGNLATNSGTTLDQGSGNITISGNAVNGGALRLGSGNINIAGNYNNTGTYTQTNGTTLFNGTLAQTLQDGSSPGTTFKTVSFSGAGTKTMSLGSFYVASTSVLTMIGSSTLAANGHLTLNSDSSGSATVAAIPSGAAINGNVNVQRYITGGVGYRGYRILSSQVYVGTDAHSNNVYGINYLLNSTFLTGTTGTAGGFSTNSKLNPTLYLYRENLMPAYTTFLNSNWQGINKINNTISYNYGMDDASNPSIYIPVGNGCLFFFRGAISTANPYLTTTVPLATTLTASGTLNTGSIVVKDWYTPTSPNLGNTTTSGLSTIEGFNCVGNPYASSIDWDTFSNSSSSAYIYGPNLSKSISFLNPNGSYGVYTAGSGGSGSTNNATHIIPSGVGFFVQGKTPPALAALTFTENAKTNTQAAGKATFMAANIANTHMPQYLRLQMAQDSFYKEDIVISFNKNAKTIFDFNEDAIYKLGTCKVNLNSLSADKVPLAVNQLPLPKNSQAVALNVGAQSNGVYSLNLKELIGIPQLFDIWLFDTYKNDSLNMRHNPSYSFTINKSDSNSYGTRRFTLVIRQNPAYAYKLLNFTANKIVAAIRQVQISWAAVNEGNYTDFSVERSVDGGKTYNVLDGVKAAGEGTYSFIDRTPVTGTNYYRLKQEDFNNTISYSKVVTVEYSELSDQQLGNKINIYPNPVSGNINLNIAVPTSDSDIYNIKILNTEGLIIEESTCSGPFWQSNVSHLQAGAYILRVFNHSSQNFVGESKFVKLQ